MRYETEINPIKRRRASLGLSQKDMAERLGITQSQYSRVEKSKTDPEKYLDRLAAIFGCNPDEIFGRKIMSEIQRDFLNDPSKTQDMQFDETKLHINQTCLQIGNEVNGIKIRLFDFEYVDEEMTSYYDSSEGKGLDSYLVDDQGNVTEI